jgi:hypothetical protein
VSIVAAADHSASVLCPALFHCHAGPNGFGYATLLQTLGFQHSNSVCPPRSATLFTWPWMPLIGLDIVYVKIERSN